HRMMTDEAQERLHKIRGPYYVPITSEFGTPGYMPPEQEDRGLLSVRSDVFALGVTTAETLASRGDRFHSGLFGLRQKQRPPGLDEHLWEYLSAMMSPRPEDRPSNMAEVSTRFRELAERLK